MKDLTERQRQVLDVIRRAVANGLPPSHREIATAIGVIRSGVKVHLDALERKGFIEQNRGQVRTRAIRLVGPVQATTPGAFWPIVEIDGQLRAMCPPRPRQITGSGS